MNRRQKKKWRKNHIIMTNRYTGRKEVIKTKDFIELVKIAEFTKEDLRYLFREEEE